MKGVAASGRTLISLLKITVYRKENNVFLANVMFLIFDFTSFYIV